MPISFAVIKKIELRKYLFHILLIVAIFSALSYLRKFFIKEVPVEFPPTLVRKIKIDFDFLEKEKEFFNELQPFEEIKPFEGKAGRENPFLPY